MEDEVKPLLEKTTRVKGGYRTLPFIIANEGLEKIATNGLSTVMTLYLMKEYHLQMTSASNVIFLWSSATSLMPLIGAISADSFLGQFRTIGFGSIICLTGTICLWLTTVIEEARPTFSSQTTTFLQLLFLCTALGLISIGSGGIRSCSLSFGANQIAKNGKIDMKGSYVQWYYGICTLCILIGLTCVVYIQENLGWRIGFAVPVVLMMLGVVSFHAASPFYAKSKGGTSLIRGFLQVVVASYKNRNLKIPENGATIVYHSKIDSELAYPSPNLRFLNKACIVQDPQSDLSPDGKASNPWRLCTVDQVEDLKSLLRVIPIWSSGIIMNINVCQTSFPILQASSMNRRITSKFEIPAASFGTFTLISVIMWIGLYECAIVPLASQLLRRPFHLSPTQRMGLGIFLSFLAVTVSSLVEDTRRNLAVNGPAGAHIMSAMWLVPQYCLTGFAEGASAVAQNEFYISEFPRRMSSIATCMFGVGLSLANLIASLLMNLVDGVSKKGRGVSWISTDINRGRYDYYYLVLAGLSLANMVYFFACCKGYYGSVRREGKGSGRENGDG